MATTPNLTTILTEPLHPYYPLGAEIAQYAANKNSVPYLLTIFFTTCAALFTLTYYLTQATNPHLSRNQLLTVMWFVLSGSIHVFFEGYYVSHFANLGQSQHLIGQMWKEYAFSDSRYLTNNAFVLCMESITAVCWGPGCFLSAWLVAKGHPARWGAVVIVSLGQLYGEYWKDYDYGMVGSCTGADSSGTNRRCAVLCHLLLRPLHHGRHLHPAGGLLLLVLLCSDELLLDCDPRW